MTSAAAAGALPRVDVPTREGTAQVRVCRPAAEDEQPGRGTLLLGHGAGGLRDATDVLALTALTDDGWTVVLVDQPWRVAGRKVATPPPRLDLAWADLTTTVGGQAWAEEHGTLPRPWVLGGRSAGARVACRGSVDAAGRALPGIAAVVALAFPLHPPGQPGRSRAAELALPLAAGLPTLVVQGTRDPFGDPEEVRAAAGATPTLHLRAVPGAHSPSRDLRAVLRHTREFLAAVSGAGAGRLGADPTTPSQERPDA